MISVLLVGDKENRLEFESRMLVQQASVRKVFTAESGEEALEIFSRENPEFVIMNADLPEMEGMETAEKIHKKNAHTRFVFYGKEKSCEKLERALRLQAKGYYTEKELSDGEWSRVFSDISQEVLNEKMLKDCVIQCQISNYFTDKISPDQSLFSYLFKRKVDFMVVEQDHVPSFAAKAMKLEKETDVHRIETMIRENSSASAVLHLEPYRYLCFYQGTEDLKQKGYSLKNMLTKETGKSFSVFLFSRQMDLESCKKEYFDKEWLFQQRYFEGKSVVMDAFFYDKPQEMHEIPSLERFESYLEQCWEELCLEEISNLYFQVMKDKNYHDFAVMTEEVMKILAPYNRKLRNVHEKELFKLWDMECGDFVTAKGIFQWIQEKCREILICQKEEKKAGYSRNVNCAMRYIMDEYGKPDLSIEDIAKEVGMGVNRLNDLFKVEVGVTVGHFITRVRMEKAKQFLEDGMRVKELSSKIGYYSSSYFSKVFKKTFLLSPKEYQQEIKTGSGTIKN